MNYRCNRHHCLEASKRDKRELHSSAIDVIIVLRVPNRHTSISSQELKKKHENIWVICEELLPLLIVILLYSHKSFFFSKDFP
jgi:hypothetical protein